MIFEEQELKGVYVITPKLNIDKRGYFFESFRQKEFNDMLNCEFVQDNQVYTKKINTIRGLHYQVENPQGKLMQVISGAIYDLIVDIRIGSKDFGKSFKVELNSSNHKMLYVPPGFAHGYLVLAKNTIVTYKCTNYFAPNDEYGIRWNDPDLNIPWGAVDPFLSDKDKNLPFLKKQKILPKI